MPSNSAQGNTLYVVGATYTVPVNIDKIQGSVFVQKTLFLNLVYFAEGVKYDNSVKHILYDHFSQ